VVGGRLAYALKPNLSRRATRPQSCHRRIIIVIHFEVAGRNVDGDKFTVVFGSQPRPHMAIKSLGTETRKILRRAVRIRDGHGDPPYGWMV
jgi:hypothetical protein